MACIAIIARWYLTHFSRRRKLSRSATAIVTGQGRGALLQLSFEVPLALPVFF